MSTAVEVRKQQLKDELTALEVAELKRQTPLSELQAAQDGVNATERLLNINAARRNDATAVLESFQARVGSSLGPGLQKLKSQIALQEADLRTLAAERDQIETDLQLHRSNLVKLTDEIEDHPVYKKAREKQAELIAEAISLAKSSWRAPLHEIHGVIARIANLASAESSFLSSCITEIRTNGLPEITPRLPGVIARISPSFIDKEVLSNAWAQANQEIERLSEGAAR